MVWLLKGPGRSAFLAVVKFYSTVFLCISCNCFVFMLFIFVYGTLHFVALLNNTFSETLKSQQQKFAHF